jgi:hypothetical protein
MLGIRIRMFLGHLDLAPLVRGMDPELDPDPLVRLRYGSGDPDPHQNVTDPQHCLEFLLKQSLCYFQICSYREGCLKKVHPPPPYTR